MVSIVSSVQLSELASILLLPTNFFFYIVSINSSFVHYIYIPNNLLHTPQNVSKHWSKYLVVKADVHNKVMKLVRKMQGVLVTIGRTTALHLPSKSVRNGILINSVLLFFITFLDDFDESTELTMNGSFFINIININKDKH